MGIRVRLQPERKPKPKAKKKRPARGLRGLAERLANRPTLSPGERPKCNGPIKGYVPIKYWLKRVLAGPARKGPGYYSLAHQIADVLLEKASEGKKGTFPFLKLLVESMDKEQPVTQEDVERKIRWVFQVCAKHVKDREVLAAIARDLNLMNDEDE